MNDKSAIIVYQSNPSTLDDTIVMPDQDVVMSLEQAIAGWIDENAHLSESAKTETAYRDTLTDFRAVLHTQHLDLDGFPGTIAPIAQAWAGSSKRDGAAVASATFNQRLAIVSSFYRYAIKHEVLQSNPIERIKRRKRGKKDAAKPITESQVKSGLQRIDRSTPEGLRDYAILSIALTTGHRASELAGLHMKHLYKQGNTCIVEWERCKGNEQMTSSLSAKTTEALYAYLQHARVYGNRVFTLSGDAPVWVSFSKQNRGQAIGTRTIANICEHYLGTSKVHATRHTAAVGMSKQGASLADIGRFLGHKNLKTTSDYMEEQLGYENPYASALEDAFGI
jgi:integrase/recombinase XerD